MSMLGENTNSLVFLPTQDPYGALYIHVPFCKQRCLYCDFETRAIAVRAQEVRDYTNAMILSIRRAAREELLGQVRTVYIGGGTPSYVAKTLTEILYTLSLSMHLTEDVECSVEANPDSVSERLVNDIWALGANRLSIGVQSFADAELAALGRVHNADQARQSIAWAKGRFENVSIDLMCGIPHQTLESFQASLEEAIRLGVVHVSIYPLTIEESTPFARMHTAGELPDIDSDFQADCMQLAAHVLGQAGFQRYEVASYAKPGYECEHNKAYWKGVSYIGMGPGAVGMAQNSEERVRFNHAGKIIERLRGSEMLAEDLMLGMRTTAGIGSHLFKRAQKTFSSFESIIAKLYEFGLVTWQEDRLVPTERGWLCGNELYGAFLDLES